MNEKATLSVFQAAKLLGIGVGKAYELVKAGDIPSLRLGNTYRIPKPAIQKLLEEGNHHSVCSKMEPTEKMEQKITSRAN